MHQQQLWIAIALILVEAGIFAYLTDTWTVPLCLSIASLLVFATEWRLPVAPARRLTAAMALAIPFTVQWAFAPYDPSHLRTFILYSLAHAGGQYGLALQTAYIWTKRPTEKWSGAFPLCGVCVLMAAGDVQTNHIQNIVFQVFVLAFTLLTAVYFSWERIPIESPSPSRSRISGRLILSFIAVMLTCGASVIGSRMLERSWTTIERIYTEWMLGGGQTGSAGFSRQARLGSISDRAGALDQIPVLRIYADEEPGYLRGAAFDRYRGGNWLSDAPRNPASPESQTPPEVFKRAEAPLFRLPPATTSTSENSQPSAWQMLDVWPAGSVTDVIFAPLSARWISVAQSQVALDAYGIVYPDDLPPQSNYRLFAPAGLTESGNQPLETDDLRGTHATKAESLFSPADVNLMALTSVPDDLDPRIRDLAASILKGCITSEQKVAAVSQWFRKNYHYELGMQVPAGHDPLTYFLIRRPPAHCEYFATGTAILLRLGKVPCRYMTGFVSSEYNYLGGYWLARNKDAHAWVEALLPGRGWVVVESTPAAGIPHSSHSIQPRHLWDDMVLRMQRLRSELAQGTWRGIWHAVRIIFAMLFTTPHGWLMLCGLIVWAIVLFRRHFHFPFHRRRDAVSLEFQRLLATLDRHLEHRVTQRELYETLHQFASRLDQTQDPFLQETAEWYRHYASVRYQGLTSPTDLADLRARLTILTSQIQRLAGKKPFQSSM